MPGPKAAPELYIPDVSHSPTTQPEGPTVGSQSPPLFLTSDQPTSLAKACLVWGSCLHVSKRSSWSWQKHPMNRKNSQTFNYTGQTFNYTDDPERKFGLFSGGFSSLL